MSNENPQESPPGSFERRARDLLDASTAKLDGRTLSRLTQARHAALETRRSRRAWWSLLPAGAATAAAVLAVVVWTGSVRDPQLPLAESNGTASTFEDMDLLADGDAPDFVGEAEDMEFYEWASGEIES